MWVEGGGEGSGGCGILLGTLLHKVRLSTMKQLVMECAENCREGMVAGRCRGGTAVRAQGAGAGDWGKQGHGAAQPNECATVSAAAVQRWQPTAGGR